MIEIGVIAVLSANTAIASRTTNAAAGRLRIYLARIPQGVKIDGGTIVLKKTGRVRDYGIIEEAGSALTTLQIDCYDLLPQQADSLAELVRAVISGEAAIGLTAGDHLIESAQIAGERTEFEKPLGATDDWRPRDSRDYRIHHTI